MTVQVAILTPFRDKYSETFIHNHIRLLKEVSLVMYGGYLPVFYDEGLFIAGDNPLLNRYPFLHYHFRRKVTYTALATLFHKRAIQMVLAEYGPAAIQLLPLCKELNIPLITHFHGYDVYNRDVVKRFRKGYSLLSKEGSAFIAVSLHMRDELVRLGFPIEKISVIPCGADTSLFRKREKLPTQKVIYSCGRFEHTKRHDITIKAFALIADNFPDVLLKITGEGDQWKSCSRLVHQLGLDRRILFTGALSHRDIAVNMNRATLFVLHSATTPSGEKEGTPVVLMEAAASGIPVVSTKHSGIPEIVKEGETGFLVDQLDIHQTSDRLALLLSNSELNAQMGEKAWIKAQADFDLYKAIDTLQLCIEQALSPKYS